MWYDSYLFWINTLRPSQNGIHFPDDILKCIFVNENVWISIKISLKFVPKGPINNIPALVQIMVWRRLGDKPLSEPMMVRLPTHICVTRPQWVKVTHLKYKDDQICLKIADTFSEVPGFHYILYSGYLSDIPCVRLWYDLPLTASYLSAFP